MIDLLPADARFALGVLLMLAGLAQAVRLWAAEYRRGRDRWPS